MTQPGEFYQLDRCVQPSAFTPDYKTSVARSPRYAMISLQNSVSKITGSRFVHSDIDARDNDLLTNYARAGESPIGERIILHGRVLDENARPVPHTLVEIWQANANGHYAHPEGSGDEEQANAADPVLRLIEWEHRRGTLIAARSEKDGAPVYRFDIQLQGENETVFFDV